MMEHTLLLATTYEPLKIISWKKAVILTILRKVEVVEAYERMVHSPSLSLSLPAVVRLHRTIPRRPRTVKFSRQNIFFRDRYTCQYCNRPHPSHLLTYDHVWPKSKGGKTTWDNVVTSCISCNLKKGNKLPQSANLRPVKRPEEPKWLPNIALSLRVESAPPIWQDYLAWGQS